MKVFLTGIKPTGAAHLGNYLGAIRPALRLSQGQQLFCSVADYHALTTLIARTTMSKVRAAIGVDRPR